MKANQLAGAAALLWILAVGLAGCGNDGDPTGTNDVGVDDYDAMDMNEAYGGLTATDEQPAFGDAEVEQIAAEDRDAASDDPLQTDPEVAAYEDDLSDPAAPDSLRPTITAVKLTWGRLDGPLADAAESDEPTDWSGMFRVDRGLVVVRRLILFERPRDHLVRPRIDRRTVSWVSHTGPHYDGLIVEIIEPPVLPDSPGDGPPLPNMVHLVTPRVSFDLPVADLDGIDRTDTIDDQGDALRVEGHLVTGDELCPKGFLSGIWMPDPATEATDDGYFKGRWVSVWGVVRGFVRGRYGVNDAGEQVFFGKYIGNAGRFRGLISGNWESADANGHGRFQGRWVDAAETVEGLLGGDYIHVPERPGGFFSGRWATLCDGSAALTLR